MKILLIAGHGAGDPGAIGCGYREADLTRELVSLIKPLLSDYADVTVYDFSRKMAADLKNGVKFNFKNYDYVFEVHFNAASATAKGTEILRHLKASERSENRLILQNMSVLGFTNRDVKPRSDLIVMNTCYAQSVLYALFETCFISNENDMILYQSCKKQVAEAVVDGIVKGFNLKGVTKMKFKDCEGHYAEKHINELYEMGVVNGDGNGNFRPNDKITRADVAIMVRNAIRAASGK